MNQTAARQARTGNTARFILGSIACGVAWAFAEVLWTVSQPLLPFEILRHQSLLPPERLWLFQLVGLLIYVPLCAVVGVLLGLLGRPLLRRLKPLASFFLGAFVPGFGLVTGSVIVWINMLSDRRFFALGSILIYASVALATAGVLGAAAWLLSRRLKSVTAGALTVAVVTPVVLFAASMAAHSRIEYPPRATPGTAKGDLPNIVFITIDTLRADHVGSYSDGAVRTPFLDHLASGGVRFEAAISQVPTTTPSHVSMFTSTYPLVHGAKNGVPMRADLATLPHELRKLGYQTVAFTSAYTTRSNVTGLSSAFDLYSDSLNPRFASLSKDEVEPFTVARLLDRLMGNEVSSLVVNKRVVDWLERRPRQPFFAWIHYFDVHNPYEPHAGSEYHYPPADDSPLARAAALYKGEVTYTDHSTGEIVAEFQERGLLDNGFVLVTSDHGEAFGEPHPRFDMGHGLHLYDSTQRVPLILWGPSLLPDGVVVSEQVESIDLAPTILDVLGVERPESFTGRSLLPVIRSEAEDPAVYAFSQTANLKRPRWFSIRSNDWKLMVNPDDLEEELFDLREDPGETINLIFARPELAAELRALLAETMDFNREGAGLEAIDEATAERLRALGYLN